MPSIAAYETSFNSDFLANTKNYIGNKIAISLPFSYNTKYYLNNKSF
jgi:hypothetical protein